MFAARIAIIGHICKYTIYEINYVYTMTKPNRSVLDIVGQQRQITHSNRGSSLEWTLTQRAIG